MRTTLKNLMPALLLAATVCCTPAAFAAGPSTELGVFPQKYQRWFDEASVEFNVPVELLQSIAYAETRWRAVVPKGQGKKNGEPSVEVDWHQGEMPPIYGVMGLRNDTHFGTSLTQAAALIREMPATLVNDSRANIRGAAALLAQHGNRKTRDTALEQWEEAVAKYSGIPEREIAEIHSYEVLSAIRDGREGEGYKIKKRAVDLEKVFGKEKLERLSSSRLIVDVTGGGLTITAPAQ